MPSPPPPVHQFSLRGVHPRILRYQVAGLTSLFFPRPEANGLSASRGSSALALDIKLDQFVSVASSSEPKTSNWQQRTKQGVVRSAQIDAAWNHMNPSKKAKAKANKTATEAAAEECKGFHGLDPEVQNLLDACGVVTTVGAHGSLKMRCDPKKMGKALHE